ncbi:MAG: dihydrofolate reductase [Gammaproteobacteria bacterium]
MSGEPPRVSLIWAMARNRVIGRDNSLPWHLPADLQHFKELTLGKPIIMGRKTWESLPGLLPGRRHIVVTRRQNYVAEGAETAADLDAAIALAGDVDEIMIVGGATLYAEALPIAGRLYMTLVDADVDGDAFFPAFDMAAWHVIDESSAPADEKNRYGLSFLTLERAS